MIRLSGRAGVAEAAALRILAAHGLPEPMRRFDYDFANYKFERKPLSLNKRKRKLDCHPSGKILFKQRKVCLFVYGIIVGEIIEPHEEPRMKKHV